MRDGSVTTTPMGKTRSIAAPIKMAARVTSGGRNSYTDPSGRSEVHGLVSRYRPVRLARRRRFRASSSAQFRRRAQTDPSSGRPRLHCPTVRIPRRRRVARRHCSRHTGHRLPGWRLFPHSRHHPRATWVRCHRCTRALSVAIVGYASCAAGLTRYTSRQHMADQHIHCIFALRSWSLSAARPPPLCYGFLRFP